MYACMYVYAFIYFIFYTFCFHKAREVRDVFCFVWFLDFFFQFFFLFFFWVLLKQLLNIRKQFSIEKESKFRIGMFAGIRLG